MLTSDSYFLLLLLLLHCSQSLRIDEHLSQIYPHHPSCLPNDPVDEHPPTANNQ
jgi:hypothetical protein